MEGLIHSKQGTDPLCETPPCSGRETVAQHGHIPASPGLLRWARNPSQGSLVYQQNGCQPSGW